MSNEKPNRYHAVAAIDPAGPIVVGQGISAIDVPSPGVVNLQLDRPIDPANRAVLLTPNESGPFFVHYLDTNDNTISVLINDAAGTSQNANFSIAVLNLFQES